jgi:hypothetical protein
VWADKAAEAGPPVTVTSETAFLVDFLPVIRRTLTRSGFVVDHVQYYRDALKPWIARRGQLGRFMLRRDPRDISRISGADQVSRKEAMAEWGCLARGGWRLPRYRCSPRISASMPSSRSDLASTVSIVPRDSSSATASTSALTWRSWAISAS